MNNLNDIVYGHKQAKKVLNVLINRSKERYYKKCVCGNNDYPERLNCLLIGQSGTGKTFLIRTLEKEHGFPLICIDATDLTPTGSNEGINKLKLRNKIMSTAQEYANKNSCYHSLEGVLNQMIVFVDEFDKLGNCFDSSGNWNKHVQSNFLTMVEDQDELAGVSWVFAGAFSSIYENRRVVKNSIGFFPDKEQESKSDISENEILKAGIIPEMLGRISLIVQLDTFDLTDYINISKKLLSEKYSKLKNIDVEQIAQKALQSGMGVRSITRQLEMALIDYEKDNPWVAPSVW